jgi:uncharacterized membrane protein YkoI
MTRLTVSVAALILLSVNLAADETPLALDKVPKPVLDAVKKRFPKAELVEAARETDGDKVEYEVSIKAEGTTIDVMVSPDGKITLIEKTIPAEKLPAAVADTLKGKYPGLEYKKAEEMIKVTDGKEKLAYYEVLFLTKDKKTLEAEVSPEGKILKTEDKTEELKKEKEKKKDKD